MKRVLFIAAGFLFISTLLFFATKAEAATLTKTPPYASAGAFVTYRINGMSTPKLTFRTISVDEAAQTLQVNIAYEGGGSIPTFPGTFDNPYPISYIAFSDLTLINNGTTPPSIHGATVTPNVKISVQAGTFTTDEITLSSSNTTIWVEVNSGLTIKETGTQLPYSIGNATIELDSTNIISGEVSPMLYVAIAIVAIIVAIIIVFVIFRRRRGKTTVVATTDNSGHAPT